MLLVTLRDLQWRARRVAVGVAATTLVFAMTLLLGAVHASFLDETDRTIAFFGADQWVVSDGIAGPFTTNSPMRADTATLLAGSAGVEDATPVALFRHVVEGAAPGYTDVNVIAYQPGGVVTPRPIAGRTPERLGEAMADESLAVPLGRVLTLSGERLTVVGIVRGLTYNGGTPTVVVTLDQGQSTAYQGDDLASAVVVRGRVDALPPSLVGLSPTQVRDDLRRPLEVATRTLGILSALLWLVAAGIVSFICYLSALDRARDIAVLKAVGSSTWRLGAGLLVEGLVLSLTSAAAATGLALALVPAFPLTVTLDARTCLALGLVAIGVGAVASLAGIGRVVRIDPALAFANT